jgi:hypothetical protein
MHLLTEGRSPLITSQIGVGSIKKSLIFYILNVRMRIAHAPTCRIRGGAQLKN